MIRIYQLKVPFDADQTPFLKEMIQNKLKLGKHDDFDFKIYKKNIDARHPETITFVYSVDVQLTKSKEKEILNRHLKNVALAPKPYAYYLKHGDTLMKERPLIIGFGPAGMFCAYMLAKNGYAPIIIERGQAVDERARSVEQFFRNGQLNEESNIQYGEGGAGTFSDGKLTARSKDPRVQMIYEVLIKHGAPNDIAYEAKPHIGSDLLRGIVKNIRHQIIAWGGEIHFNTKMQQILVEGGQVKGIVANGHVYLSDHVVLALGNSARDTLTMLSEAGVHIEAKDIAIGMRIEHRQSFVDKQAYHRFAGHPTLPVASYFLTNGKGAYTFCMCPGGEVIASTSLKDHVVVNGMSTHARDLRNANSAILLSIPREFYQNDWMQGVDYLDRLERKAYVLGGGEYKAPCQNAIDFVRHEASTSFNDVKPSYPLGVTLCDLHELFDVDLAQRFEAALLDFDKQMPGFLNEGILTAVESRSTSPARIVRDQETLQSVNVCGLYPCGEGAGYAGGIISSAVDGVKVAERIITTTFSLNG